MLKSVCGCKNVVEGGVQMDPEPSPSPSPSCLELDQNRYLLQPGLFEAPYDCPAMNDYIESLILCPLGPKRKEGYDNDWVNTKIKSGASYFLPNEDVSACNKSALIQDWEGLYYPDEDQLPRNQACGRFDDQKCAPAGTPTPTLTPTPPLSIGSEEPSQSSGDSTGTNSSLTSADFLQGGSWCSGDTLYNEALERADLFPPNGPLRFYQNNDKCCIQKGQDKCVDQFGYMDMRQQCYTDLACTNPVSKPLSKFWEW